MAELQNFRSAFNGFNREDVVHYIEYINNKHASQVNQLKAENQTLQSDLNLLRNLPVQDNGLEQQLEEANARYAALEQKLAEAQAQLEQAAARGTALQQELAQTQAQLEQANARGVAKEQELAQTQAQLEQALSHQAAAAAKASEELEAYRRAERTERMAQERAAQLSAQANGIIADATVKVDEAAAQFTGMADQVAVQIGQLQTAILDSKSALQEAAATLYALRPASQDE